MSRIINLAVLAVCLMGMASIGGGKELQTLESMSTTKSPPTADDLSRYESKDRQRKPTKSPNLGVELVPDDPISIAEPELTGAFQHFDALDNGNSFVNAYLCDYLSEEIYADQIGYSAQWETNFRQRLINEGAIDVTFEHNATYGAELAAVWLEDAVIIVCRGSHMNGSTSMPFRDWVVDADDDAVQKDIGDYKCHVHEGVWNATNSVYTWIRNTAVAAIADGKQVWITGHSLGGATGTIAAARLHYDDGLPVQGLHTFGSFKVGDDDFKKLVQMPGAGEYALENYIQRWAVNGDYATTLFWRDLVPYKHRFGGFYVYYEHVGRTHQITRSGTFGNADWTIDFNTDENTEMIALPDSVLPYGEHGDYVPALRKEIQRRLSTPQWEDVLEDLLRL